MPRRHVPNNLTLENYLNLSDRDKRMIEYDRYINSNDPKLKDFRNTGQSWLEMTENNKRFINHEVSRGTAQEDIVIQALKRSMGAEANRVVSGQILTIDPETGMGIYSTQQDILVLRKNADRIYEVPTYSLVPPEDVLVVIEVKSKLKGMTGKNQNSIESILKKNTRVNLNKPHILFGVFGFEKSFTCSNLKAGGISTLTIDKLVEDHAPMNFLLAASDKYFVRKYMSAGSPRTPRHYYFEQGLSFGYFIANVLHHIDLQDGIDEGESTIARFPMLTKTPAQVLP